MQITLELPEDVAQGLESTAYRSRALTAQLRRLLGF
jgi:hypothetical protein